MQPEQNAPSTSPTPQQQGSDALPVSPTQSPSVPMSTQLAAGTHTIQPLSAEADIRTAAAAAEILIQPAAAPPSTTAPKEATKKTESTPIPPASSQAHLDNDAQLPPQFPPTTGSAGALTIDSIRRPHKKLKAFIIIFVLLILAGAGYFAYTQYFHTRTIVSDITDNIGKKSASSVDTPYIVPKVDYPGFDSGKLKQCLGEMVVKDYGVECKVDKIQKIGDVEVSLVFNSGKLTDQHEQYLYKNGVCNINGLAMLNKLTATGKPNNTQATNCQRVNTPAKNPAYMASTNLVNFVMQDYYFVKDKNVVTISILAGIPGGDRSKVVTTDTITSIKQNALGFIDSMLK